MATNVSTYTPQRNDPARALRQQYADEELVDVTTGGNDWTPKQTTPNACFDALHYGGATAAVVVFITLGGNTVTVTLQPGERHPVGGIKVLNAGTTAAAGTLHALYF